MGRTYVPCQPRLGASSSTTSATVPVVALALGSVAGLGAARVATSHYSLMVRDTSQVFVAGPPVVARARRARRQGGARRRATSTAATASSTTWWTPRRRRSNAPAASCRTCRPRSTTSRRAGRADGRSRAARRVAHPRHPRRTGARSTRSAPIIESVVDLGSFLEIGRGWGRSRRHRARPARRLAGGGAGSRPVRSTEPGGPPTRRTR